MVTCRSVRSSSLGKTLMPSGGSVVSVVTSLYTRRMMWGGRFSTLEFCAQRGVSGRRSPGFLHHLTMQRPRSLDPAVLVCQPPLSQGPCTQDASGGGPRLISH